MREQEIAPVAHVQDIAPVAHVAVAFHDGSGSAARVATLQFAQALEIFVDGTCVATWPYADIRRMEGPQDAFRITCRSAPPTARLEIRDDIIKHEVLARCGIKDIPVEPPHADRTRAVGWALAAVVAAAAITLFAIPYAAGLVAPMIPRSIENRLGDVADYQVRSTFKGKTCIAADGVAAFAELVEKVRAAGGLDLALTTQVLDVPVANAFALPGGRVYLFNALLARAENPDELAGVIAHEFGHVSHRDHMRAMIQSGGMAFVVGLVLGDVTGAGAATVAIRSLLDASYSRDAESQADAFAIATMHRLGRSPAPMGALLLRITGAQAGRGLGILASHPMTEARRAVMQAADRPASGPDLLSAEEWRALRAVCRN
jgi:Zn-dependent protease with chaperone function